MVHLFIKTGLEKNQGYPVDIFPGQFSDGRIVGHCLKQSGSLAIITDDKVRNLYALKLAAEISQSGRAVNVFEFPNGDENKTRKSKTILEDEMLAEGFGRDTTIIAVGGGVVTDMAGFIAATYARGVPIIYVPTSLLAMVDVVDRRYTERGNQQSDARQYPEQGLQSDFARVDVHDLHAFRILTAHFL